MQRVIWFLVVLLVTCCGFAISDGGDGEIEIHGGAEVGYKWRKLLESGIEDVKTSTGKGGKEQIKKLKIKAADGSGKVKPNASAGTKDVSTQMEKVIADDGKTGLAKSLEKISSKKKVLEEEDDEDLRFIEEERLGAGRKDAGKPKIKQSKEDPDGGINLEEQPEVEKKSKEDLGSGTEAKEDVEAGNETEAGEMENANGDDVLVEEIVDADDEKAEEVAKKISTKEEGSNLDQGSETDENKEPEAIAEETQREKKAKRSKEGTESSDEALPKETVKKTVPSRKSSTKKDVTNNKPTKLKNGNATQKPNKKKNQTKKAGDSVSKAGKAITSKGGKADDKKEGVNALNKEPISLKHMPVTFSDAGAEDVEDLQTDAAKHGLQQEDEDDEEGINILEEFSSLPTKIHETAGQVAQTLRPGFERISETSKGYFTHASKHMTESLTPIIGEQVAPVVASLISYALLLVPLILVLYMLERIRASLSMAKVLFFVNLYLAAYFLTLVLATFALHGEPMAFFFRNSRSSYIFLQLLQAFGYFVYILLYGAVFVKSCSSEGVLLKILAAFQLVAVVLFGLHYYVTVFHRAMAMKVPRTTWKVYMVYSGAFALLCLVARAKIERTKKEYYYTPVDDPDEAIPVDKRS